MCRRALSFKAGLQLSFTQITINSVMGMFKKKKINSVMVMFKKKKSYVNISSLTARLQILLNLLHQNLSFQTWGELQVWCKSRCFSKLRCPNCGLTSCKGQPLIRDHLGLTIGSLTSRSTCKLATCRQKRIKLHVGQGGPHG